jgi:hypothetical protein
VGFSALARFNNIGRDVGFVSDGGLLHVSTPIVFGCSLPDLFYSAAAPGSDLFFGGLKLRVSCEPRKKSGIAALFIQTTRCELCSITAAISIWVVSIIHN